MSEPAYNLSPDEYGTITSESAEPVAASSLTRFVCLTPLWINLFVLTIAMGGVSPLATAISQTVTFCALGISVNLPEGRFAIGRILCSKALVTLLAAPLFLIVYGAVAALALQAQTTTAHPVLGAVDGVAHPQVVWETILSIGSFTATLLLACMALTLYGAQIFAGWMTVLTWTVCFIALSHWFYDTGRLFWLFEPNNVGSMARARWPFVNPNHLGHCCLLLLAFGLVAVRNSYASFENAVLKDRDNRVGAIVKRFSQKVVQQRYWRLMVGTLLVATTLLTLFGSLSRGSWLGLAIVSAILTVTVLLKIIPVTFRQRRARRSYTIAQRYKLAIRKGLVGFLVVALLGALVLFLQGRGSELVQERIIYGLTNSKDDLRWMLYTETKPILFSHAWTGIGLGQWPDVFRSIELPEISGFIPEFLHSDPYQLLVEIGVPAFMVFSALIVSAVVFRVRQSPGTELCIYLSFIAGFLAASFLDFPFRIPALSALFALTLARAFVVSEDIAGRIGTGRQR